jgi:hypothetical protein
MGRGLLLVYWNWGNWVFISGILSLLLVAALPVMIVGRLKSQMIDWHSALTPRYRWPHLVVAGVISTAIFLLAGVAPRAVDVANDYVSAISTTFPVWYYDPHQEIYVRTYLDLPVNFHDGLRSIPPAERREIYARQLGEEAARGTRYALFDLAESLLLATLIGFAVALLSPWKATAITTFVWLLLRGVGWAQSMGIEQLSWRIEEHLPLILLLLAADLGLCVLLWFHISRIPAGGDATVVDERFPWLANFLGRFDSKPLGSLMRAGLWQRARHRRLIGLGHRFSLLVAGFLALVISVAPSLNSNFGDPRWFDNGGFALCTMMVAVITSILAIGLSWPQRFTALADVELLRPSRRDIFAREIGLAMLSDTIEMFSPTCLAMLIPVVIWSPAALQTTVLWTGFIAAILTAVPVYGVIVWAMPRNSPALTTAALMVCIVAGIVLIGHSVDTYRLVWSAVAAAMGVALAGDAYRRWMSAFAGVLS